MTTTNPLEDAQQGDPGLAVQRLIAAQRVHRMYPPSNPNVRTGVRKLCEVAATYSTGRPLELGFEKDGVTCGGEPVQRDQPEVAALARQFYLANVMGLVLEPDVTEEEVIALLEGLKKASEENADLGGFSAWLRQRGVARLHVREAGVVSVEMADGSGAGASWNATSLRRLEELEREVFGGGEREGFRQTFRGVGDGEDAKVARLTGLLARPVDFTRLLLDVASQQRVGGQIDLDQQLATALELVAEIEPMIDALDPNAQVELYAKLNDVANVLERTIQRELLDSGAPPYVHLGPVLKLFPATIRNMTVAEALALGPGPGLSPLVMGALRRVAGGDPVLPAFLSGAEAPAPKPYEVRFDAYRPVPLGPAPPSPPRLGPPFFEPRPGGKQHPAEVALAQSVTNANGIVDSTAILRDLLAVEHDLEAYEKLMGALVTRYRLCLKSRTLGFAREVLLAIDAERARNAVPELGVPEFLAPAEAALDRCGSQEAMAPFVEALASLPPESTEIEPFVELIAKIGPSAVSSLASQLGSALDKHTRRRIVDILTRVGRDRVELFAAFVGHEDSELVRGIITVLGQIGSGAVTMVVALARHPDPMVRREAIRTVGGLDRPEVLELLIAFLADGDDSVARDALNKLVTIKARSAGPALTAVAATSTFPDRDRLFVLAVGRALGQLGDRTAIPILSALADAKAPKGHLKAPEVRAVFAESLEALRRSGAEA